MGNVTNQQLKTAYLGRRSTTGYNSHRLTLQQPQLSSYNKPDTEHITLMDKMGLPDEVYNGIRDLFSCHSIVPSLLEKYPLYADITASVIPGSSLGPASYTVDAADLRPWHAANHMIKFADDTYLIIPATNSHTRDEITHVKSWAAKNNLQLNCAKSHEIVFHSHSVADSEERQSNRHLRVLTSCALTN